MLGCAQNDKRRGAGVLRCARNGAGSGGGGGFVFADEGEEELVDAGIVGELGVKGGGEEVA